MHWRIRSFTELQHLTEEDRKRLIQQCLTSGEIVRMIIRCILIGGTVGIGLLSLVTGVLGLRRVIFQWLAIPALLAGAAVIYQLHLIRIRGQMRLYLEKAAKQQRLPMCLRCGYNLEGLQGETCPECGLRIRPAGADARP
jgi:hypothetical protein